MKIKLFTLPNLVSLCNLACGCLAVGMALLGAVHEAFWLVLAAAFFDFCDGLVARLTGQYSAVGRELDSLCDVVSFGAAPAAVLWSMGGGLASILLVLFSALRLAKFNVDDTQHDRFVGLPTPACALLVCSLGAWMSPAEGFLGAWGDDGGFTGLLAEGALMPVWAVWTLTAVLCALLVCPMPMFALKFKGFGWRGNEVRYLFLGAAAMCVAVLGVAGVAATIALYIIISTFRLIF